MNGEKAQQHRNDLEKGGLRVSPSVVSSAPQPLGPARNLTGVTRNDTERPRSRVRRLLVSLAIAGFVFYASRWDEQSHAFVHQGKGEHGLYGKKAEELFLFVSIPQLLLPV